MADVQQDEMQTFEQLGLSEPLLRALDDLGYEAPTPIQEQTIPPLLEGRDVVGQAQTGTGKTAAFALPILECLELKRQEVQAIVLAPTRELALQVSEAIHSYAKHLGRVHVLPVYGGQPMGKQIGRLRSGVHVVVGTPGRVMDHLRRGTLNFDALKLFVLDEADEMLRMGFIDDVDWILAQAPEERQIALFSATMPPEIRRIADRYLENPVSITIQRKTLTVPTIEQRYVNVSEPQKVDALTRILEIEPVDAALVFVRTKVGAAELAEKLQARGYSAEAIHGDMSQSQREQVVRRLRGGQAEIAVATDVAARGWDVENISHVINYDIPYDVESYVHRIGRTGRAGRTGKAILFVTPRQQRLMRDIERYTKQRIEGMKLPTQSDIAARRTELFKERIRETIENEDLVLYLTLVESLAEEGPFDMSEVAAALACMSHGEKPLEVIEAGPEPQAAAPTEDGMVRFYIDAGRNSGMRPNDVVGAIANEAGVPGKAIGAIDIYDQVTFVDIPAQYKEQVLQRMAGTSIRNQPANIKVAGEADVREQRQKKFSGRPGGKRGFHSKRSDGPRRPRRRR